MHSIGHIPNKILDLDELAKKKSSSVIAHIDIYNLYHKELHKNLDKIKEYFKDKNVIIMSPFATLTAGRHPVYENQLRLQERVAVGAKKGYDLFSSANSFSDVIINLELNISGDGSNNVFIPISPVLQFAEFDHENGTLSNIVNKICDKEIVKNVNSILFNKNKELIRGQTLDEGLNDDFCYVSPALYDSDLAREFFSSSKEEDEQIKYRTQYLRIITAIMFSDFLKLLPHKSIYYHGEKTSSAYNVLKKMAAYSRKSIHFTKTMENAKVSTYGAADISAQNKLEGKLIFEKALSTESGLTIEDIFPDTRFDKLFEEL